jgi:transposase
MEYSKTKNVKTVNERMLIVAIDIGKSIHHGYFRGPDGQDIKPFPFYNGQKNYQEFWLKILTCKHEKNLKQIVVGFESTGPYAEPLMNFLAKKPVKLV